MMEWGDVLRMINKISLVLLYEFIHEGIVSHLVDAGVSCFSQLLYD